MRPMRLRLTAVLLVTALLAAACGASASAPPATSPAPVVTAPPTAVSSAGGTPSSAPSAVATPGASKGPPTAQFTLTGTAGLSGGVTINTVSCDLPSLTGPQVEALGKATDGSGFVLFVTANHIEARVASGDGPTLKLRSFVGSGVSAFDAATGATLDSDLTESTPAGAAIGTLGALDHIAGTLDCGNQQPGSATVTISGPSTFGPLSGPIGAAKVTCTTSGSAHYVTARALTMAGTTPVLVFVNAGPQSLQLVIETGTMSDVFGAQGASASTTSSSGAQFSTDLTENVKAGATPLVLHVEGSDTCAGVGQ